MSDIIPRHFTLLYTTTSSYAARSIFFFHAFIGRAGRLIGYYDDAAFRRARRRCHAARRVTHEYRRRCSLIDAFK